MSSPYFGTIQLLQTPLSSDNEHQIRFSTKDEQFVWFDGYGGIRKDNYSMYLWETSIKIDIDYVNAIDKNYMMYQATSINSKWFYYFITSVEFVNIGVTQLNLKLDVWQTWQFDITFDKSFIEREHTIDYLNSLSDIPATGTLIQTKSQLVNANGGYFVFCNSDVTKADTSSSTVLNFKLGSYSVPSMVLCYSKSQFASMASDLQNLANKGFGDRISSVVYVPLISNTDGLAIESTPVENSSFSLPVCLGTNYPDDILKQTITFDFSDINLGFKKALTFPYAKIVVQDLATGQTIELEPNKFNIDSSQVVQFELQSTISENPSYKVIPLSYKNQSYAYNEALVIKCNTQLPIANNSYAKYLLNNQDLNLLRMIGNGIGVGGAVVAGSAMGAISGFESITNVMLQEQQAQRQPNQLTAITDGVQERIQYQNGLKISLMIMDSDHLEQATNYWNMYGYPIRKLDYPNTPDRYFYFIKMQDPNISGNIPQNDLNEISSMFSKGVTLWQKDSFRQY